MDSLVYVPPPCAPASSVFKLKGRWYARVHCPRCGVATRVRLSLGPMVARCGPCDRDVEADVTSVLPSGSA